MSEFFRLFFSIIYICFFNQNMDKLNVINCKHEQLLDMQSEKKKKNKQMKKKKLFLGATNGIKCFKHFC